MPKSTHRVIDILQKTGIYGILDHCRDYLELAKGVRHNKFSQFAEDQFLRDYFGDRQGLYIDVGGNHPFRLSNTYLLYRLGWKGLVVEPIHRLYAKHKRFRPRDVQVNAAAGEIAGSLNFYEVIPACLSTCDPGVKNMFSNGSALLRREYTVPVVTLAELYRTHLAPHPIALLSVDTEGHDLAVLRGIDWTALRPEIVICEANDQFRESEIRQFMAGRGYDYLRGLGVNLIFALH